MNEPRARPQPARKRETLLDFYRSCFMLFVFYHHICIAFRHSTDFFARFNPFAELFVIISGFMVGMVYLPRQDSRAVLKRAWKILLTYWGVGITVAVGRALVGSRHGDPVQAALNILLLQEDPTLLGILRFYGMAFLLLPLVFVAFRYSRRLVFYSSAAVFVVSLHYFHAEAHTFQPEFFFDYVVLSTLQWQFLFVIGIFLGDFHKKGQLLGRSFLVGAIVIICIGLLGDLYSGQLSIGEKFPYNFEKYLNLMWTAPALLLLVYVVYRRVAPYAVTGYILNIGKNSLVAFTFSEVFVQLVRLGLWFFKFDPPVWQQQLWAVSAVFVITTAVWWYARAYRGVSIAARRILITH